MTKKIYVSPPAPECGDSDQGACMYVCEKPKFQNWGPQKLGPPEASDLAIDGASDLVIHGASDKMDIHKPLISGLSRV